MASYLQPQYHEIENAITMPSRQSNPATPSTTFWSSSIPPPYNLKRETPVLLGISALLIFVPATFISNDITFAVFTVAFMHNRNTPGVVDNEIFATSGFNI